MNENERRIWNRELALNYVKAGIPIFPTDPETKTPLVKRFTQLDSDIPQAEKDQLNAEKHAEDIKADREPTDHDFIGCTLHHEVIRKMWRKYPNATPSISTGPAGLIVIDADIKEGINGPDELRAFFQPHGGIPKTASVVHTQSGGLHVYFRNTAKLGCKKGAFADLRCDVRGIGGQVVAPVAIREDGKTYSPDDNYAKLIPAFANDLLCDIPDYVVEMIGNVPTRKEDSKLTTESEAKLQSELEDAPEVSFGDLFTDSVLALYDIDKLSEKDSEFKELYANPTEDTSNNRFRIARRLLAEWPTMPINHYATFLENWEGAGTYVEDQPKKGEYNDRSIKREFVKGENDFKVSDTSVFGAADDEPYEYKIKATNTSLSKLRDGNQMAADWAPMEWLVKGMIPAKGVGVLYGVPNVGKSFIAIDLANRVGRGKSWMGHKTERAGVLYLYSEGEDGLAGRFKAWCDKHGVEGGSAMVAKVPNIFEDRNAVKTVVSLGKAAADRLGLPLGLVIVDTLAASSAGADENSAGDMSVLLKRFGMISDALNASVLVIHHVTKSTGSMRGSGAIEGAIDYSLLASEVTAKGTSPITRLKAVKLRDAAKNREGIPFKLEIVVIGKDKDGDDVTSCVVKTLGPSSALDVVVIDTELTAGAMPADEEPGAFAECLTSDQNAAIEAERVKQCNEVAAWSAARAGKTGTLSEARMDLPFLTALRNKNPSNFAGNVREHLMCCEKEIPVNGGKLHFIQRGTKNLARYSFRFEADG